MPLKKNQKINHKSFKSKVSSSLQDGDSESIALLSHMNAMNMQMRSMNRLMNSFMPDPFNMLAPFDGGFQQNALMERQNGPPMGGGLFGFPAMPPMQMMHGMPNMNRLLSADIGNNGGASFCSSSVITMSSGPDGRPQIYQATSSTKTGPGGIRETRRTVQDSVNGVKKMAIGHHIGERAHIIEKEQDTRSGQLEERQEFINLDEDEAEDFDREFTTKASSGRIGQHRAIAAPPTQTLTIEPLDDDDDDEVIETTANVAAAGRHPQQPPHQQRPSSSGSHQRRYVPALPTPPSQPSHQNSSSDIDTIVNVTTMPSSASETRPTPPPTLSSLSSSTSSHAKPSLSIGAASAATATTANNNSPYVSSATPRRSSAYRSSHISGASPRRPLRTPPSSPLATTPTMHNHSTASSPSVHPHPYNSSAARRSHHHHHHHHQQQHQHRSKHGKHSTGNAAAAAANANTTANAANNSAVANSNSSNNQTPNHREEYNNQN
ncbi:myeloid leukemia factor isoform X1 [Stomoxys calcitrans]|uniref:myeloid leukemia factor isoform X1 n=2 Tax=Stomoxys calcitrans TaxID=35570 RepID=UPI0027E35515|nr:myeloid leukemia factor isoform X1 [Stomoxys calcitrans]